MFEKYEPNEVISIYGSHDASVTFIDKSNKIRIYEYERYVKKRYAMFSSRFDNRIDLGSNENERKNFLSLIKKNLFNTDIKLILHLELGDSDIYLLQEFFPNATFKKMKHHYSHAASGFFASPFNESLIFSVDGGGWDIDQVYTTRVYLGKNDNISELICPNVDLGNPYSGIGWLISEIKSSDITGKSRHALSYAGKIMGLCAYGNIREEWINFFIEYYNTNDLELLCKRISVPCHTNSLNGQMSYDFAATSQYVFEKKMDEIILPYVDSYKTNVVLVGGCALNVLYNQKLYEKLREFNLDVFVPSNPNDCGESYGMFLSEFPNIGRNNEICYNGIEILDEENFNYYLENYPNEEMSINKIVNYLKEGKIFGIINDYSEVGPRSLGNRSIICDPSFKEMKDILNDKVKFREWFRPFAPVCRLEDMNKFFMYPKESNYMSYAPKIKSEYEESVKSITHEDKTTRLQTTTKNNHSLFYEILTELNNKNHIPIILNTSFNIKGLPILTTYKDAFYVLDNTELDFLIIKNKIFSKK